MNEIRVLIADDEQLARTNLREALRDHPGFPVVGEVSSGSEVVEAVRTLSPDLVLLDIEMPGSSGVSVARELSRLEKCPAVVFVTAYSEFAVDAFELCALDYVLKPFDDQRFAETLARAAKASSEDTAIMFRELTSRLVSPSSYPDRLLVRSVGSIRVVPIDEVVWLGAGGNYVEVHHREGVDLHRASLVALQRALDPRLFFRVHRSAVVRLSAIREVRQSDSDASVATMSNGDLVRVSQGYRESLLRRLEGA
ncbi:MAG: LytTR family DNA-binding domain-containing protein [Myxococcota bacterium]